jgi:hypothetical protein
MPRRKPTPAPRKASGGNIAESARHTAAVKLRLSPRVRDILRDQAAEQGLKVSALVAELVERTWGRMYETTDT